jgi:uncharacterized protein YkwD
MRLTHFLPALMFAGLCACASAVGPARTDTAERDVVERSNAFRRSHGLGPVAPDRTLTAAAQSFAAYMARTDRYGHEADGREPSQRAQAQGYAYCMVAENIAMLYSSAGFETRELAAKFVQGWIDSPGHRRNLLAGEATDIGVGIAQSAGSGRYYAVQLFGRPARLKLSFSLSNRSRESLRYQLDDKSYALPPGMTRTHEQCTTPALSLTLPGDAQATTLQPVNGAQLRIEPSGRGLRVTQ